jgi:predicted permease
MDRTGGLTQQMSSLGGRMEDLINDIRYGMRTLFNKPGFAAIAIISLALGIGANTSIFSLVNTVLLRPLPIDKPEETVSMSDNIDKASEFSAFSYPNYIDYRDRNDVLSGLAAYRFAPMSLSHDGRNNRIWGYVVSGNYFDVLGVKAVRGRTFTAEEDTTRGSHPVAVMSYAYWQRQFGGDPEMVGKSITINGRSFTVIGIAPKGFSGTELVFAPVIWVPLMMAEQIEPGSRYLDARNSGVLLTIGRLKPGVSRKQAESSLSVLAMQLAEQYKSPERRHSIILFEPGLFGPGLRGPVLGFAGFLMLVVAMVLLIACTNLASLLLAKSAERRKEMAIRLALGAGRMRLIRQLITESVVLSVIGGGLGILLAFWLNGLVVALKPPIDFPLQIDLHMDGGVLLFSVTIAFLSGVLFGLAPALQATKADVVASIKDESTIGGYRRSRLRNSLVIAQVALSLILLVCTGLIVRSLQHAQTLSPGFDPNNAIEMSFDLALQGYDKDRGREFDRQLLSRVAALPGIKSAGLVSIMPLALNRSSSSIYVEGQDLAGNAQAPTALVSTISPQYFRTMAIPLVEGRDFSEQDKHGSQEAAIVNEEFARTFWPGQEPLGKRFHSGDPASPLIEVVGVAKNGKYLSLGEDPKPFYYRPLMQSYESSVSLVARTEADPLTAIEPVRRELLAMEPTMPIYDVDTLTEHMGLSLFPVRIAGSLIGAFGVLALILAAVGIYGVMSYNVAMRTREIGLRMALGAGRGSILLGAARSGLILTTVGMSIGLIAAALVTRLMSGLLYGVPATDPATFGAAFVLLGAIAVVASYVPARRASRIDPMAALRCD